MPHSQNPQHYIRRVRRIKYILIAIVSTLIIVSVIIIAAPRKLPLFSNTEFDVQPNTLTEPYLDGHTNDGTHYTMRAVRAQMRDNLRLETISGTFNDGAHRISAPSAVFFDSTQKLEFYGPVSLLLGTDTTISAEKITFSLKSGDVHSMHPIQANSQFGSLHAGSFHLAHKTATLVFANSIQLKLNSN